MLVERPFSRVGNHFYANIKAPPLFDENFETYCFEVADDCISSMTYRSMPHTILKSYIDDAMHKRVKLFYKQTKYTKYFANMTFISDHECNIEIDRVKSGWHKRK